MAQSDVFVRFGADIGPLEKGVNQASSKLGEFGAKGRETVNVMGKVTVAAAAAGAALGVKLVSDSLAAIDAQAKLAKQLGTSSASIATLNRAADMSGISMSQIEAGAKNLDVAMGEAAQGTGVAVDTLKRLGLTAKDLEGMTLDEKILTVNQALKDNIPANERAAAAADLFGKRAGFAIAQLDPATLTEATRQVEGMGLAISDVDAAKIEAANDAMSSIGLATDGIIQQFTIALAPILEDIAVYFQEMAMETGGFKDVAVEAVESIAMGFGYVGNAIRGVEVIIEGLALGLNALKAGVFEISADIAETLESLVAGFAESINSIIELANNVPGVNIGKLIVGKSEFVSTLRATADEATLAMTESIAAFNQTALAPLPSEVVEEYIASLGSEQIIAAKQQEADALVAITEEKTQSEIEAEDKKAAALKKIQDAEQRERKRGTGQFLDDVSTLTQSGNKKLFAIGKAAAAANVIIDTQEAAMKAYKWAAGWGGPVAGGIAAGAAIAAGGIRLQAINSASIGGGGGGVGSSSSAASVPSESQAPQQQAPEQSRTLRIEGFNRDQLFTGDQLNSLAEKLVEYQEDGFKLVV